MTARLVAFDLDGTLLDSVPSIVAGVRACWEALGFPEASPEDIRRIVGLPWERGVAALMPGAGAREVAMIRDYHDEIGRGVRPRPPRPAERPFPGAAALLDRFEADGYRLALVTSRSGRRIGELLAAAGLGERSMIVRTADDGPGKPDPFLLRSAMEEAGAGAAGTVMIGDTTYDVETALNAGAGAIGVAWGVHGAAELDAGGAHGVAHAFDELPGLVERVVGGVR